MGHAFWGPQYGPQYVCSSELCLDVIFVISSHFGSFFSKNDKISLISVHQNLAFRLRGSSKLRFSQCLCLFLFFTHFSGVEGLIYTSLGLLFAAIWGPLGLSWPPLGGTCDALSGIWRVFFQHLVPNVPPRRSQSPPGIPCFKIYISNIIVILIY